MASERALRQATDVFEGAAFSDDEMRETMFQELADRFDEYYRTGVPLRVYAGYDASRPHLHLGHTITMRKLRLFQEMGHHAIFLIGTLTAQVGDPSDRLYGRPRISREQVIESASTYLEQLPMVLDPDRTEVRFNGDWLSDLTLPDVLALASAFTVQQATTPAMIKDRLRSGDPVGLHELCYPLMQAYDAYHLRADVQLGTTGPVHNILAGRRLQKIKGQRPCVGVTFPVLWGTRGHRRMSKREGTALTLREPADEQFGKVMSIDDVTMRQWVPLVTSWSPAEARDLLRKCDQGELHPMELKLRLAADIVATYHGSAAAQQAGAEFSRRHRRRQGASPDSAAPLPTAARTLLGVMLDTDRVRSVRQARELLEAGAVRVNDVKTFDPDHPVGTDDVLGIGKRHRYQLRFTTSDRSGQA